METTIMPRLGLAARVVALLCIATGTGAAQQHAHARDTAERLGTVHFATSCDPAVSRRFDRAVALLHSFEFGASIRAFTEVAAADSTCAMAHWGIALSRWGNPMAPGMRAPARELLGDLLMELQRPADALIEYRRALVNEPDRYHTLDGARRAALASGDRAAAAQYAARLRRITRS